MYKTSKVVFSPRVRKSPYFNSTIKYGAQAFSVYNHMYMPISFEGTVEQLEDKEFSDLSVMVFNQATLESYINFD